MATDGLVTTEARARICRTRVARPLTIAPAAVPIADRGAGTMAATVVVRVARRFCAVLVATPLTRTSAAVGATGGSTRPTMQAWLFVTTRWIFALMAAPAVRAIRAGGARVPCIAAIARTPVLIVDARAPIPALDRAGQRAFLPTIAAVAIARPTARRLGTVAVLATEVALAVRGHGATFVGIALVALVAVAVSAGAGSVGPACHTLAPAAIPSIRHLRQQQTHYSEQQQATAPSTHG
jgi:hypothetical protein